ncbi:endonuclease-reverse transcriptase [Elysia marginata]|uniref:Endonuclease-reverse transcriptase n=1 Tax=Elysia marginata TaxID=1093978 RepID=A0AAV4FBE9_9GAST|nr:endonuclease-reverse transcriptase [Elysia marginata]
MAYSSCQIDGSFDKTSPREKTQCGVVLELNGKGENNFKNYRGYQHLERRQTRMHSLASPLQPVCSEFPLQETLADNRGISLNGENITNVRYADDTVIMAETPESHQQMFDRIAESYKTYGMEINTKKTKTMRVRKEKMKLCILIDRTPLEQVTKYQYLGHIRTEDVSMKKETDIRTEKASAKFWKHKELLRRTMNIDTKKRILRCYVFSVFNYECETQTFTKAVKDKIKSFEMWCYRRVVRISWKEHKTNEDVLQAASVTEDR